MQEIKINIMTTTRAQKNYFFMNHLEYLLPSLTGISLLPRYTLENVKYL